MNIFAAPWRPAQARLAPVMGQQTISTAPPGAAAAAAAARPSLIDSALMAILLDATVVGGSLMLATGYMKKAKANPSEKGRYKPLGVVFFGLMGLSGIKLLLDGARLGQ